MTEPTIFQKMSVYGTAVPRTTVSVAPKPLLPGAAIPAAITDSRLQATGIPKSYYDEQAVAAGWYWSTNPVALCTPRMILVPNDDRGAAERAAGSSAVVLRGTRQIWEEYKGGSAIIGDRIFMRELYKYCQQRIFALLPLRAQAEASPDGGWAWMLTMIELVDAAMRATNVAPFLLYEMIGRRLPGSATTATGAPRTWASLLDDVPTDLRNNPLYKQAVEWSKHVTPDVFRPLFPYQAISSVGQGDITQYIEYVRRPEGKLADASMTPQAAYGRRLSLGDWRRSRLTESGGGYTWRALQGFTEDQVRQQFSSHRGQWWIGSGDAGMAGPAAKLGDVEAMARMVGVSSYEAWISEGLTLYTMLMLGGAPSFRSLPVGRPFVSPEDLSIVSADVKKMSEKMLLGTVTSAAAIFTSIATGNLKAMVGHAIALFSGLFADPPPDVVSLLNPIESPFRRELAEAEWSTASYPGGTDVVSARVLGGLQKLATALADTLPPERRGMLPCEPGTIGCTRKTVWSPTAVQAFLARPAVEKKPFLSPLGVVSLAVLSVVGIAYWKTR